MSSLDSKNTGGNKGAGIEKIFRLIRAGLLELNRVIELILKRLREAQDLVTDSVRGTLPVGARHKFAVFQRVAAKMLDLLVVGLFGLLIPGPFGPLAGFVYSVCGDGLQRWGFSGQSLGKRMMGLRVIRTGDGQPANFKDAMIRNLPVGVATFFAIIPLWGWIICILVGVPLMLVEITLMARMQGEARLGDIMAGTRVLEKS